VVTSKPANGATQNKDIYNLPVTISANIFSRSTWRALYWPHLGGRHGHAGMRPERRSRGRNGVAAQAAPFTISGEKAVNPGSARAAPSQW